MYTEESGFEDPTPQQKESIRELVNELKRIYNLTDEDIYKHDEISYKTTGEGSGLYE